MKIVQKVYKITMQLKIKSTSLLLKPGISVRLLFRARSAAPTAGTQHHWTAQHGLLQRSGPE